MGLFLKLKNKFSNKKFQNIEHSYEVGLKKASVNLLSSINELEIKNEKILNINDDFFKNLEKILLKSDISFELVEKIINSIKKNLSQNKSLTLSQIKTTIVEEILELCLEDNENHSLLIKENDVNVILVVGVNGTGKTTSIAKLAKKFVSENKKVLIVAGDTFRAGAVSQLQEWAKRLNIQCIAPAKEGQDPSSVIFDGVKKGVDENYDIVICDTAGRMQNKINLMQELSKVKRVISKIKADAPCETLLVLDATTGQNGISQAKNFHESTELSGIILTKMDGSSKGGIILSIKKEFNIPVKLIGFGEKLEDLKSFDMQEYLYNLVKPLV